MSLETQMGPKFFVMRFFSWACHSKIPNYKHTRRQKYKTRVGHYTEAYRSLGYYTIYHESQDHLPSYPKKLCHRVFANHNLKKEKHFLWLTLCFTTRLSGSVNRLHFFTVAYSQNTYKIHVRAWFLGVAHN